MAPAADADITPFGMSCAGGAPLALQLGWGMCLDHQFAKLEELVSQGDGSSGRSVETPHSGRGEACLFGLLPRRCGRVDHRRLV
jgi:hypothetical protein